MSPALPESSLSSFLILRNCSLALQRDAIFACASFVLEARPAKARALRQGMKHGFVLRTLPDWDGVAKTRKGSKGKVNYLRLYIGGLKLSKPGGTMRCSRTPRCLLSLRQRLPNIHLAAPAFKLSDRRKPTLSTVAKEPRP